MGGFEIKKHIIIKIGILIICLLVLTSSRLYKDTKRYKQHIGAEYKQLVTDTRDIIKNMNGINLGEAMETAYGTDLIKTFNLEIRHQKRNFFDQRNQISEIFALLEEVDDIQYEAIENGTISEDKVSVYMNDLKILNLILLDFENNIGDVSEWYKTFTEEVPDSLVKKMEKRIKADY